MNDIYSLDPFTEAYLECALWSSVDDNGAPLDDSYGIEDLSAAVLASAVADCVAFQQDNASDLAQAGTAERCGHYFWLTRNGHGAGFWDRCLGEVGERLTKASKTYGSVDLYAGEDGLIY